MATSLKKGNYPSTKIKHLIRIALCISFTSRSKGARFFFHHEPPEFFTTNITDMRKASKLLAFSWNKPNEFQKKPITSEFNLISAFKRILFDHSIDRDSFLYHISGPQTLLERVITRLALYRLEIRTIFHQKCMKLTSIYSQHPSY